MAYLDFQTIRAEDNGGKFSTATLNVEVGDSNDQIPEFVDQPYSFKVKEGLAGATVGQVKAKDNDIGRNAKVFYQVRLNY
jgi:protocadherin-15